MSEAETQIIMFLLTTLVAVVGGALRWVLARNAKLEKIIDDNNVVIIENNRALSLGTEALVTSNTALAKANEALAVLVKERANGGGRP